MIKFFSQKYEFLNNFSPSPLWYQGKLSPTAEHAYQAAKFLAEAYAEKIRAAKTPGLAKKLSRQGQVREDWDQIKSVVMQEILFIKFSHPDLKSKLLATGDQVLVEGNYWHDNFWGNCYCPRCQSIPGHNLLGKLLMALREKISSSASHT